MMNELTTVLMAAAFEAHCRLRRLLSIARRCLPAASLAACLWAISTSFVVADSEPDAGCCGVDRPLVRAKGWPIPEVRLATSRRRPLKTESATVAGMPLIVRTYRGTHRPYSLPRRVTLFDTSDHAGGREDRRSTSLVHVYVANGRPFCLFLFADDEPDCPECGVSCKALLVLYDNDGDGIFETLEPAGTFPPYWKPTLPSWLGSTVPVGGSAPP